MRPVIGPLLAMMAVQAMTTMATVTVPVMAPAVAASLGRDPSGIGYYQSIAFAGAALFTLMSGSLVRRHGGVRVNQLSIALSVSGLAVTLTAWLPAVVAGGLLAGAGYGLATPGASHVLARVTPAHRRGLVFSLKQSAVPLGGLLAGVVVPPVVAAAGWQWAVMVVLVMVALAAPAIEPLRARLDDDRDVTHRVGLGAPGAAVSLVLRTPALRPLAMLAFSYAAMQLSLFAFLVTLLVERAALDLVTAGLAFAVMQGVAMAARVFWGWVSDHYLGGRRLLAGLGVGTVASTLACAAFSPAWPLAGILAVAAALGLTAVGWNGLYLAEVARAVPPAQVGIATGGTLVFTFAGVVVGPATFSALVTLSGGYWLPFLALDALVLATVIGVSRSGRGRGAGGFCGPTAD